jgi:hypothetical protein
LTTALLPVTVVSVERSTTGLYKVEVVMADGTSRWYMIPDNLATVEGVRVSALAIATLSQLAQMTWTQLTGFPDH